MEVICGYGVRLGSDYCGLEGKVGHVMCGWTLILCFFGFYLDDIDTL